MAIIRHQSKKRELIPILDIKNTADILATAEKYKVKLFPFDIEKLIFLFGIEVLFEDLIKDISGYIEKRDSLWVIGINKYHSPRRQRFTLAHEFCHYVFHKKEIEEKRHTEYSLFRDGASNPIELEANNYAAELLMPTGKFREQVEKKGVRSTEKLADIFDVSIAAARYKAYKLGYISNF